MRIIKYLISAIIAFVVSKVCYDSSIIITIAIFCLLNVMNCSSDKNYINLKEPSKNILRLVLLACPMGGLLIVLGKYIIYCEGIVITGAILFSPTVTGLIVFSFIKLIRLIKSNKTMTQ